MPTTVAYSQDHAFMYSSSTNLCRTKSKRSMVAVRMDVPSLSRKNARAGCASHRLVHF